MVSLDHSSLHFSTLSILALLPSPVAFTRLRLNSVHTQLITSFSIRSSIGQRASGSMQLASGPAHAHRRILSSTLSSRRLTGAFSRPLAQSHQSSVPAVASCSQSRRQLLGSVLLGSSGLWLGRGSSSIATAAAVSEKEKVRKVCNPFFTSAVQCMQSVGSAIGVG